MFARPTYDPEVIRTMARRLLLDARAVEIAFTAVGALFLGFFVFSILQVVLAPPELSNLAVQMFGGTPPTPSRTPLVVGTLIGVFCGGLLGYGTARSRTGLLQAQAHLALCQVEMERHLRDR